MEAWIAIAVSLLGSVITGAITYGAITTKMEWLRADVEEGKRDRDRLHARLDVATGDVFTRLVALLDQLVKQ